MTEEQRVELEAALAEFSALRDEIVSVRSTQKNVVSIALTAYAAVFAVALADHGNRQLLLVLPPLGLGLCLIQMNETYLLHRLGRHIRLFVWPRVQQLTSYRPSWELDRHVPSPWRAGLIAVFTDGVFPIMLTVAGVIATVLADTAGATVCTSVVSLLGTVVAPVVVGVAYLRTSTAHTPRRGAGRGPRGAST